MAQDGTGPTINTKALERILEVTCLLAVPIDLSRMLTQVIDAGREILRADRGTVFLYDATSDELYATAATGEVSIRFPATRGIAGECAKTRQVVNVPDCYADPRFNRDVDRKTGYRTRCLLTVPLIGYDDTLVGVLQVLNKEDGVLTTEDERIATALAAQCAVALQRVRMMADLLLKEKMERELAVAREIQMRVLPREIPAVPGYDIAGWSRPADETGGDVYDIIPLDEQRLMLLLGDATGHGIGPALSVTQVRAMLRIGVRLGAGLDSLYTQINSQLVQDLADNRFVTAFLGELDAGAHTMTYHSGGQGPLLHYRAGSREVEWHDSTTLPMGFIAPMSLKKPQVRTLEPGDIFALMTDGIYEYANPDSELFGNERVAGLIRAHETEPMSRLIEIVLRAVEEFGSGAPQGDDMTMLFVRRLPA